MGPDAMILAFWMFSFKPTFSLSSFTFIKRLFLPTKTKQKHLERFIMMRLLHLSHPCPLHQRQALPCFWLQFSGATPISEGFLVKVVENPFSFPGSDITQRIFFISGETFRTVCKHLQKGYNNPLMFLSQFCPHFLGLHRWSLFHHINSCVQTVAKNQRLFIS